MFEGSVSDQDSQVQVLYTEEVYLPEEQKAGNTRQRPEGEDEGEGHGNREGGTKDRLWIERRQMWPTGKWEVMKVKGENPY